MKRAQGVVCTLAVLVAGTWLATRAQNVEAQTVVPATGTQGKVHILPATMETTQWGWYDNAQKPVLMVKPGDTIIMETMMHFHDQFMPGKTLQDLAKIRADNPGRGAHTLTGPIYVDGAEPGDVLKVRINKIVPRAYGMNVNYPGVAGLFPKEFPDGQIRLMYLDWDKKVAEFLPGVILPLRPFPGILGVARAEPGRYSTVPPGRYGGNLDLRELTAGTSLHVPVFVKGALLWASDGHAAQGNGEINLTAIETAFKEFNITVDLIKGRSLEWPRVETPTHWLTVGYDEDSQQGARHPQGRDGEVHRRAARRFGRGCPADHAADVGLPHRRSRQHRQRGLLLQLQGYEGEGAWRAADEGDGNGLRCAWPQRRPQQGDGRSRDGDDQPASREAEADAPRRLWAHQYRRGLPAWRNLGGREERTLPDAEESVAGPQVIFPHHAERAAVRQPFLIFGTGLLSYVDVSRCPS